MAEVELVVDALIAGAAAGIASTTTSAVQDAYAGFRDAVRRHLLARGRGEESVLAEDPADEGWRGRLRAVLLASDIAGQQPDLVVSARSLLELLGGSGNAAPHYDLREAKGVIVGDHSLQINEF